MWKIVAFVFALVFGSANASVLPDHYRNRVVEAPFGALESELQFTLGELDRYLRDTVADSEVVWTQTVGESGTRMIVLRLSVYGVSRGVEVRDDLYMVFGPGRFHDSVYAGALSMQGRRQTDMTTVLVLGGWARAIARTTR